MTHSFPTRRSSDLQFLGQAIGMAATGLAHYQMLKPPLRHPTCGYRLVRIFVTQLVESEVDARKELAGGSERFRAGAKQPRHLGRRFQMTLSSEEQTSAIQSLMHLYYAVF